MKLEKFKEKDHKKKITIGISIVLVLLIAGIIVYRSFAFYEKKKAFDVIKGQVPDQNYDLMFSFYLEDENNNLIYQETIPEEKDYLVTVECNNGATGVWDEESWGPRITNLTSTRTKCKIIFQENVIDESKKEVSLGQKSAIQEYYVSATGIYKLEVWGAQGGYNGGKGGYSVGYKQLKKGDTLYIATGGQGGAYTSTNSYHVGGYNGGGSCFAYDHGRSTKIYEGAGGGATHIALNSNRGELKNYVNNKDEILLVAGGGGGTSNIEGSARGIPGTGGGASGGSNNYNGKIVGGGTQTAGGVGIKGNENGSFGQGGQAADASGNGGCGGGGGWYGGAGGHWNLLAAAGGSGYIGGVPSFEYNGTTYAPTTTNGQNTGNGKAKITFVDYL